MPSRKACIIDNRENCHFVVHNNPRADGSEPIYEISAFSDVSKYSSLIDKASRIIGVDARLIRAIMYVETTHGYYDAPLALFDINKSILPMNVNVDYWGDTFGNRKALENPYNNILAGAKILKRIINDLPSGASIQKIATLYNNLNAQSVSNYGARVAKVYAHQPWLKGGSE